MSKLIENFLRYVAIDTKSDEESETMPSTAKQHNLAELLVDELTALGIQNVYDREHCYVYGFLEATEGFENAPALGFIAHMDTSPAVSGTNVKARIVDNYDGKDIVLNKDKQIVLKTEEFPELTGLAGESLIVTDGTTLLGADDKAGIAEIMTMVEELLNDGKGHGKVCIGFTPDEEVGRGADYFDLAQFGATYAYTVDGGALGELEYENFNAAGAKLHVYGRSVHPGSAKGKMINAILVAQEFQSMLPPMQNPMYTEGYEGFFHPDGFRGNVEEVQVDYIIRDHDMGLFEEKKALFLSIAEQLNQKYGNGTVVVDMKDSYYNMKERIKDHMHLIDNACEAMRELGIEPKISPIRGGTDGARLTFMGLPCPNLCTGGANYHSRYEYVSIDQMEKTKELLKKLVEKYSTM